MTSQKEQPQQLSQPFKAKSQLINGILYKKILEAKWAVFLISAGIRHQYDPGCFDIGGGEGYSPQFYLLDSNCFFIVKSPSKKDAKKILRLCDVTGKSAFYRNATGFVPPIGVDRYARFQIHTASLLSQIRPEWHKWTQCSKCRNVEITHEGDISLMSCRSGQCAGAKGVGTNSPFIRKAYIRSHLFKHQEGDVIIEKIEDDGIDEFPEP